LLRSVKYGLYGAVLAGLIGGTVAWTDTDKTVHLLVDGRHRTIHTTASSVGAALEGAGYHPTAHDLLAPAPSSALHDDATIVLNRGRLLRLDVDGRERRVWTTAPTVAIALGDLGFSTSDFSSVSRSRRLPLSATDISVRTPKRVTVTHDGRHTRVTTTDATLAQLLRDIGLTAGPDDRFSVPVNSPITAGEHIRLTRVKQHTRIADQAIPYTTRKKNDPSLSVGITKLVRRGTNGVRSITWAIVYVDGNLAGRTQMRSVVVRKPIDQVVQVGTKDDQPASDTANTPGAPAPAPGSAQEIAKSLLAKFGWSADQFDCLNQMWIRESGWRVDAANPSGAYGIPQALPGSKMSSAGPNWQSDARTQITWGLGYIKARYNSPCQAWSLWQSQGWY
jgi:resuscitation-promoting factor RpfB